MKNNENDAVFAKKGENKISKNEGYFFRQHALVEKSANATGIAIYSYLYCMDKEKLIFKLLSAHHFFLIFILKLIFFIYTFKLTGKYYLFYQFSFFFFIYFFFFLIYRIPVFIHFTYFYLFIYISICIFMCTL